MDATLPITAAEPTSDSLGDTEGPEPSAFGECVGSEGAPCAADELLSGRLVVVGPGTGEIQAVETTVG